MRNCRGKQVGLGASAATWKKVRPDATAATTSQISPEGGATPNQAWQKHGPAPRSSKIWRRLPGRGSARSNTTKTISQGRRHGTEKTRGNNVPLPWRRASTKQVAGAHGPRAHHQKLMNHCEGGRSGGNRAAKAVKTKKYGRIYG